MPTSSVFVQKIVPAEPIIEISANGSGNYVFTETPRSTVIMSDALDGMPLYEYTMTDTDLALLTDVVQDAELVGPEDLTGAGA